MSKRKSGIRKKMLLVSVFPTILLGLVIFFLGIILMYGFAAENTETELKTTAYMLKGCFDMTVRGDYTCENGVLRKGDVNISDSSILYEIKKNSGVDTTIFWGDTRILTTIEDAEGVSAVGTKSRENPIQIVLKGGEDYFIKNALISGKRYMGFYTPLKNHDGTIIGMVFAGRAMGDVYWHVSKIIFWFMLFTAIAIGFAIFMSRGFSKKLVLDIDVIKHYLHMLTVGNFTVKMDSRIVERKDEIAEIGAYAIKMGEALETMIERDTLTSLYNRRSAHNRIKQLVDGRKRFTIVMADIDWFKKVNDKYGHECGDHVLIYIAKMLRDSVGEEGFACRWGGEEFLLVYEMNFKNARERVETLLNQIREFSFDYNGQTIQVTMTFGMKDMKAGVSYEKIIKEADDNLYRGKSDGRDRIVC